MSANHSNDHALITRIDIGHEGDIITARQHVRMIAEMAGFENQDQIRIATSVSEIARNAYQYAKGAYVEVEALLDSQGSGVLVKVIDQGPGISNLDDVLSGRYQSTTGLGRGLLGTRRLMDYFDITTGAEGTTVTCFKKLPARVRDLTPAIVDDLRKELQKQKPAAPLHEVQRQNQELILTLDELRCRQEELALLNEELDATNRGVLALYAELEERANYLKNIDDMKKKFMANMTHEFRTPLTSIIMLAEILIDGLDGPLLKDQEKQIHIIKRVAEELSGYVDDLLDLAKIEAGHATVRSSSFSMHAVFDVLKGMLKPITKDSEVTLTFEYPRPEIYMDSDEGKISQILRNFISNAIKFTPEGTVRVTAQCTNNEDVIFCVADTGLGIKPEHIDLIFQEFGQVECATQTSIKSTGLGLSISNRLAGLLGGKVWAESRTGEGSQFYLSIPKIYQELIDADINPEPAQESSR